MFFSRLAVEVFSGCSPYVRRMSAAVFDACPRMFVVYVRRMFAVCSPYLISHYPDYVKAFDKVDHNFLLNRYTFSINS